MCLHPKFLDIENKRPTFAQPYSRIRTVVPCGHCVECLKQRQANFATRIYLEARQCKKMFFVTFTYRNEELPIAMRIIRCDKETGVIDEVSPYKICDKDVADTFRPEILSQKASCEARYAYRDICDFGGYVWRAQFTPSLNRKHIRDWLKKRRIQYERAFGSKLPTFTYAFCGEYGPRGGRPHYHALFMGLDNEQLSWLLSDWNIQRGYTYTKEIPILNADGTDARLIVANYVGKYIAKGKFDLDSCQRCDCEKGRLCASIGLGNHLTDEEIAYYRAYDLYGEYDINTMRFTSNNEFMSFTQETNVIREVSKRRKISLGLNKDGKEVFRALPMYLCKKIYCVRDTYEDKVFEFKNNQTSQTPVLKTKVRYVGSLLSSKVSAFQRGEFVRRHICEYRKIRPEIEVSDISIETYFEILCWSKDSVTASDKAKQETDIQRKYFSNEKDNQ